MSKAVRDIPQQVKTRFVYDASGNVQYIREFSILAKLGEQKVNITEFIYNTSGQLINIFSYFNKDVLNYLDLNVPPQPTISNCVGPGVGPTLSGTCTTDNGDIVYVFVDGTKIASTGTIAANAFSFVIDLTGYSGTVSITVKVENDYGLSKLSSGYNYSI